MARPKDDTRRQALLDAATRLIAEHGVGVSTSRISALAGVSEGSLFTYFKTKDELYNVLFCQIQAEVRGAILLGFPQDADVRGRLWHVWRAYVGWGVDHRLERQALAKLRLSEAPTPEARALAASELPEMQRLWADALAQDLVRPLPTGMAGLILKALGEMTMELLSHHPKDAEATLATGFDVLWGALRRDDDPPLP